MSRPRLEVSAVQVVATVLAAVTGALLASYLGVVGTIAGTAVASAASTTATAIYRHYLGRTRERLGEVGPALSKRSRRQSPPVGTTTLKSETRLDVAPKTRLDRAATERVPTFTPHQQPTKPATAKLPVGASWKDRLLGVVRDRRMWLRYGVPAIAVFALVTAGITGFELASGKTVSSAVWGKASVSSTSDGSRSATTKHTSTEPATQPSADGTSAATGKASASPSTSASASPSASSAAAASPSPSPSASASSTATANAGAAGTNAG
jgi:hypothetical protein